MPDVLIDKRADGVALITLNRPDSLNAIGGEMTTLLPEILNDCASDPAVRCVAVTGAGRGWCAGGDVKGMARAGGSTSQAERSVEEEIRSFAQMNYDCVLPVFEMLKPTVALLNGVAAGGGMGLALAFDIRIASDRARFVPAFKDVGQSGDFGMAYFLPRLVGPAVALELMFTNPRIDAQQALELRLVNRVLPHDDLMTEGLAFCSELAQGPTAVYGRIKQNLIHSDLATLRESLGQEAVNWKMSQMGEDHRAGIAAFIEKRPPRFVGR